MGILLEFALLVLVIFGAATFAMRMIGSRAAAERESVIERRVEAYMATIRRERTNPELAAMSDEELRDLLLSGARNLRIENDRRLMALLAGSVVGLVAAILAATQNGLQGFGVAIVVAALVLYGMNEILVRKSREPLVSRGIDVERLRVE
ncbi:MAG: hypothetical protein ACTHOR_16415 [Devosia sp.]|jgi:uncharacterized protein YjiS (DUF1127 family)|nr:hypothetical protein [Devosiaceae bacterium]